MILVLVLAWLLAVTLIGAALLLIVRPTDSAGITESPAEKVTGALMVSTTMPVAEV